MGVILVAYERESEQTALEQMLVGRGHRVLKASTGLEALDLARRATPHLIVSDIVLPRMDGFALCRKWKQDERLQSVPFIFYTRRHDDPKYERFALELGAERFLARTTQPETLTQIVDELVAPAAYEAPAAIAANDPLALPRRRARSQQGAPIPFEAQQAHAQALSKLKQEHELALAQAQQKAAQAVASLKAEQERALERAEQAHREALERLQQAHDRLRTRIEQMETTQQHLAAGEARFRRVFEANPLPMWIEDLATHGFIAVNDAALELYGYRRAEFLSLARQALEISETHSLEQPLEGVATHKTKSGATLRIALTRRAIEFDGRSAELVCAYDLTERIRSEQARLEAAVGGRAHIDSLGDGFLALDGDGSIIEANAAYCRLSGFTREQLLQMSLTDLEQSSITDVTARLQRVRLEGSIRYEGRHQRADGAPFDVEITIALAGTAGATLLVRDVTQQRLELAKERSEHARTLSALQRADVTLQGMIESLVRMSERHDPFTAGSARRVAALAVALAREAGLDGRSQDAVRMAALLHDVGNIAVPASVLAKPGELTPAELALMRTHVEEGCKLLAEIDFGAPVAEIVFEHHERVDGSGYPRGIKGHAMLIESRVLAIADTLEAMCSPRPYRAALDMHSAIEELNRQAGKLFDQQLVSACARLVKQRGFVFPE